MLNGRKVAHHLLVSQDARFWLLVNHQKTSDQNELAFLFWIAEEFVRSRRLIPLEYTQASSQWPFLWFGFCSGQPLLNRRKEKKIRQEQGFHPQRFRMREKIMRFNWANSPLMVPAHLGLFLIPPLLFFFSLPDYQGPEALYHRGWDVADWFVHPHMLADRGSPEENCGRVQLGGESDCLLLMLYITIQQNPSTWS